MGTEGWIRVVYVGLQNCQANRSTKSRTKEKKAGNYFDFHQIKDALKVILVFIGAILVLLVFVKGGQPSAESCHIDDTHVITHITHGYSPTHKPFPVYYQ